MPLWEGFWLDLWFPPFWVCHCSRSAVSGTSSSSASSLLTASKGEVSWLECLSAPSNSPASPLDLYQDDPDNGDERGRLSFTQSWCYGDLQPWVRPAPGHPSVSLGSTWAFCYVQRKKGVTHELALQSLPALPLPGTSKQRPRSCPCPGSPFLAPMALIPFLSLSPRARSGGWRVLHGQQPACGNNESKSGSAILHKPLSALCVCVHLRELSLLPLPSLS